MELRILGPLEAWEDGRQLDLGAGRQRALLALLLLRAGEVLPTERLIDELWGEHPPPSASKVLQNYVSRLRRTLGADAIVTRDSGYLVRARATDADEFERLVLAARAQAPGEAASSLRRALSLWRGPPLSDVAYDSWAQPEIARLEELRLGALEDRIDAELSLGHAAELIPELEALIVEHPLRERLLALLMLALYRTGRQAEALSVFTDARRRLVDDLGIEPGPELQDLQRKILGQDPALGRSAHSRPLAAVARRARWLVLAGIVLVAGAASAAGVLLTRGGHAVVVLPNSIAVLDATSGRLIDSVPVGNRPAAVAVGLGSVWVANADDGTVSRIDPRTRKVVAVIGVGFDVSDLVVGFDSVWVADGNDGTVTRIDPGTNSVQETLSLETGAGNELLPNPVYLVASDDHFLWATRGDQLLRIEPATNAVKRVPVGTPLGLTTGGGATWVTTLNEHLLRVQPNSAAVADSAQLPAESDAPVFAQGSLWLLSNLGHGEVIRVDPSSLGETGTADTGGSPTDLAAGDGSIWVAHDDGVISKIDPRTMLVASAASLRGDSTRLIVGYHRVWVAVDAATE